MGGAGRGIRGDVVRVLRADVPTVFCQSMPWRTSWEIGLAELGAGSIVPASGAGGLALGAWILSRGGMPAERIARRSVAFFLIKSSVNFVAVAVLGTVMALGLVGPDLSLWLTAVPAAGAAARIAAVLVVPRLGHGGPLPQDAGKTRRALREARKALVTGTAEAVQLVRSRNFLVIVGSIGYWALGQRGPLGDLPRLRPLAPDQRDPDGLPDRAARRAAAAAGRPRRNRRRADRHADRLRRPRRPPPQRRAHLPRDPVLAAAARWAPWRSPRCERG